MSSKKTREGKKRQVNFAVICIRVTFNNTIISITDIHGNVLVSSSSGRHGFKGSKKATPYAAQVVMNDVLAAAKDYGVKTVSIKVKGPGTQRESAIRAMFQSPEISATVILDVSPVAHNGVRPPKKRRV
ncbi:MAG TPA: 30S ribosomal protein S11 [Candidatus Megaira endosymbiont of Hartmannula sinica]|nr:30S ribosomal protein S11 [Candidatus Megaera endosymbiont of Hartmannula sinica]